MSSEHDRRDFLKTAALASAAITLGSAMPAHAATSADLVKVQGLGVPKDIAAAVKKALEPLGGMQAFVKKGQRVVLKPNMGFATEAHIRATTDPKFVAAVAREVLACEPGRVLIVDNPMRHPDVCLKKNGIQAACKGLDVHVVLPTSERFYKEVSIPKGKQVKKVKVLKDVIEADVHIPLPLAKSHMAAGYSGAVKGHMGIILDRESFHSRFELNQAIADLASILPTPLTLLDGLQVMAQGGPAGPGELVTVNAIVAGKDILAVDAIGVKLAPLYRRKIKPKQIRHLRRTQEMGIGKLSVPDGRYLEISL